MGGKRQANVLSSIIKNFDTVEDVIQTSLNAEGSAFKENEKYLDSIQGRIDLFNNSVQTFWTNLINSNAVKGIVDIGTSLVQTLDTLHGKIIAIIAAVMAYSKIKNGVKFSDMFNNTVKVTKQVITAIKQVITATKSMSTATVAQGVASQITNKELARQILIDAGLAGAEGQVTKEHIKATAAKLTEAYSNGKLSASQYLATMSTMGLKTALQGLWTVLKSNPVVLIASVVAAAALAFDHFHTTAQEASDAAKEAFDEIQSVVDSTKSAIQSLESELSTLQDKVDELNGKSLSFADEQELEKLQDQRKELEHSLKIQQQLLELQKDASNKQAVASMKAYTKAASEGAEKTQKTAETIGTIAGVIGGALLTIAGLAAIPVSGGTSTALSAMGVSTVAASVGIGAAAGGLAGNKAGEAIGSGISENEGTYDSWYKTYTDALDTAREDEQKALKKYQNDSSDIKKLDKWQEAQQRVADIETEMYDHLSQMQQYFSGLEYGVSDEIDQELDTWNNFLDKFSIDQGASGSEVTALDRIFGENASEDIKELKTQILDAVSAGEDFDFASAINESQELKNTLDYVGLSAEDVAEYFTHVDNTIKQAAETTSVTVTDLASLSSAYDSYASALQIVNDTMFDGQAISDDYYNSLSEYLNNVTIGEESFSDAVDTTNGNVIKNTKLLRNLIAQKKKEQKATISAARAQGQLQYTKMVKQLQQAVKAMSLDYQAYGYVTKATYDNISAVRSQIQAIKNAIKEYAVLELKLSDVTNAYDEFEDAKNRDAELTYGDSMIEMLKTISDGFLSGQVGSEAFKAAVHALVPDSVIANYETFEERLDAIDDYFENSKFADYFTIDENGNFSIAIKNIEAFIADAKEAGAFLSNADGTFTIDDSIQSFEDLAKAMGLTEEAVVAMVTEFSKYDASWGDIIADFTMTDLDRNIRDATDALDQAITKQEQFFKDGKDPSGANAEEYISIQQEVNNCSDALNNAQKAVIDNANAWIEASNSVDIAKEKVATLTKELQELQESGATDNEIQIKTNELENATKELSDALQIKYGLEEPTQMDFQVSLTEVQSQIDQWKEENSTLVAEVVPKLAQDKDGVWKIPAELDLDESEKQKVQAYVDLLNNEQQLESFTSVETNPIIDEISQVSEILNNIYDAIESLNPNADSAGLKQETDTASNTVDSISSDHVYGNVARDLRDSNPVNLTGTTSVTTESSNEDIDQLTENSWFDNAKQSLSKFGTDISTFFTETLPEQWNSFWESVGTYIDEVISPALSEAWNSISEFFTVTLPEKWNGFWTSVGEELNHIKEWASERGEDIKAFFTETLPEKWNEFWESVGDFFASIPYAVGYLAGKVSEFFTDTLPEKWNEFWEGVQEIFNNVKQWASDTKENVVAFFTETLPEKWDEFWESVGDALNSLKEYAIDLKNKVVEFFTVTIPEKWSSFWESVGVYIDETLAPALSAAWDKVVEFFTVTIPEKWSSFWESVGAYIDEVIAPALSTAWDKIVEFFTTTIPEKWTQFWNDVGTYITETLPTALENIKDGITTFFTETVPGAINGLWESAKSWIVEKAGSFWENLKSGFTSGYNDAKNGNEYNPDGASSALGNALAKGNAHSKNTPGFDTNEHNAIVGELGRELVVDPNKGIYYTVGENGTQMVDLPKGAIVYNHKQTEELLKNGETSRGTYTGGLSFAKGNAYWEYGTYKKKTGTGAEAAWGDGSDKDWSDMGWNLNNAADGLSDAADDLSDVANDFKEIFDWFEVLIEEIDDDLNYMSAALENAIGISAKNDIQDQMINVNKYKLTDLGEGYKLYADYAAHLLEEVPQQYRDLAKNGGVALTKFLGEANQEVVEAINNYREWAQKAADVRTQQQEVKKEITSISLQKVQTIADEYDRVITKITTMNDLIQANIDLIDEQGERTSAVMYEEMIKNSSKQLDELKKQREAMQKEFDAQVSSGNIEVGSEAWYEGISAIQDVDKSIIDCRKNIESFQNSINQLHWDNFDKLIDAIDNVGTELSNLGDLIDDDDAVDEMGNWTDKGITKMGLLAQEMERAQYRAQQYAEQIDYLNQEYAAGKYSTDEYNEKLQELKDGQFDSIKSYEAAKDAIVDLNKARVESAKNAIQKEIDAYSDLISKKKEELQLTKDAHDFSKQVAESQKNIANIEKQLAAISGDNSAAAVAKRKKLQAELAAAQEELDELYYSHNIEQQGNALDKNLEDYQDEKDKEMEKLDEYLKNVEQVIADSFATITGNTETVAETLKGIADEYGINLSEAITSPWEQGSIAIGTYQEQLDTSISAFTQQLEGIKQKLIDLQTEADKTAKSLIEATNQQAKDTSSATYTPPTQPSTSAPSNPTPSKPAAPSVGSSVTVKKSATNFSRDGGNGTRMQSWVPGTTFTVYQTTGSEVLIGRNGGYTGWVRLSDIEGYRLGVNGVKKNQLAITDEDGLEELVLHAGVNGKLQYLSKGSSVIPSDITENLMELGQLDPRQVLERNMPKIGAPYIVNNNMEINMQIAEVVHIDHADSGSISDISKAVQKQMDSYMKNINSSLKRYTR